MKREGVMKRCMVFFLLWSNIFIGMPQAWSSIFSGDKYQIYQRINAIDPKKFNIHDTDSKGDTILHYVVSDALDKWLPFVVKKLIAKGVNVNAKNVQGDTPLM